MFKVNKLKSAVDCALKSRKETVIHSFVFKLNLKKH